MADLNNDIGKYLSGKLSPQEMNALERKALNDPFLAEALEGAAQVSSDSFDEDLSGLRARLNTRVLVEVGKKPQTLWTWPLRIAAGLVLIICASVVIIALVDKKEDLQLAFNKTSEPLPEPQQSPAPPLADSATNLDQGKKDLGDAAQPAEAKRKAPAKAREDSPAVGALQDDHFVKEQQADQEINKTENPKAPILAQEKAVTQARPQAEADEALSAPASSTFNNDQADKKVAAKESRRAYGAKDITDSTIARDRSEVSRASGPVANTASVARAVHVVKGQVVDYGGTGLPGVNVVVKGTDTGTVTDATGNYQINVKQNDPTLLYSFIGYATTEINTSGKNEVNVKLEEDLTQLSEVVVTGYGIKRDPDEVTSTLELAAPKGGQKAFKEYLENSLQYPQKALQAKIEGKVTVQFAVEPTGLLTEFRVLKGIGGGCDEELVRLIKSGPKWNPMKSDNEILRSMVKVRMKFELPKK